MKKNEPISSIMTRDVVTLSLKDTLYSAEKRMKVNHIRHMPVVDGKAPRPDQPVRPAADQFHRCIQQGGHGGYPGIQYVLH